MASLCPRSSPFPMLCTDPCMCYLSPQAVPPPLSPYPVMPIRIATLQLPLFLPPRPHPRFHSLSSRWSSISSAPHHHECPSLAFSQPSRHLHLTLGSVALCFGFSFYGRADSLRVGCCPGSYMQQMMQACLGHRADILQQPSLRPL